MGRTYYQIELTARQLTALLLVVAVLMVVAFALGYAAAWSMFAGEEAPVSGLSQVAAATGSPSPIPEVVLPSPTPRPAEAVATATSPPAPTATPTHRAPPTAVPTRRPTRVPPTPTAAAPAARFWVQVLAGRSKDGLRVAQRRLERFGFPRSHQRVVRSHTASGRVLYKLRVGPFPDHDSAQRVRERMRSKGFPDAWVVTP